MMYKWEGTAARQLRFVLSISLLWGIFAHGYFLTHRFTYRDEAAYMFAGYNHTADIGRWMLDLWGDLFRTGFEVTISMPFVNGTVIFICMGLCCYLLIKLFAMKNPFLQIIFIGAMMTSPMLIEYFFCLFTSHAYACGMLLGVCGAYCVAKGSKPIHYAAGVILILLGTATYQSHFAYAAAVLLTFVLYRGLMGEYKDWRSFFGECFRFLSAAALSLAGYLLSDKIYRELKHVEKWDYKGYDTLADTGVMTYVSRIPMACRLFFRPDRGVYPSFISKVYKVLLLMLLFLILYRCVLLWRESRKKLVMALLPLFLFPMTIGMIYIMSEETAPRVWGSYTLVYLLFLLLLEQNVLSLGEGVLRRAAFGIGAGLMLFICIWFAECSNATYVKGEMLQSRAKAYFTILLARMQGTEGYVPGMPVHYRNSERNLMEDITVNDCLREGTLLNTDTFITDFVWQKFFQEWVGYWPISVEEEFFTEEERKAMEEMPHYPADGSLKVVHDAIVVNF